MRTITLELLRHGPAHNQLLSPLTPYLALCENHPAVTVHVPFEHNQFLHRLNALSYKSGREDSRIFQLQDTARAVGDILSQVPGLTAELSKVIGDDDMAHLRLIISASELALLPFELALSPGGFPGSGQHLLLQPQAPLCLTRETRRAPGESVRWPLQPRILFVAAAPPGTPEQRGVGAIPLESHLLALRRAVAPWVRFFDEGDDAERARRVAEHLTLLPDASVEAIERECSSGNYTHVHILAHGVEVEEGFDRRFYLALHDAREPEKADFISGPRLATALRVAQADDGGLSRPTVVTLASCDSGNVGTVAGAGSSIAHALHEAGIPVVVAGQFPLSFAGSVRLVEMLYEGLLWGADPRRLVHDLRRRLFSQFPATHDWASLTAYMSLPPSFDEQLPDIQAQRSLDSLEAATSHADAVTRGLFRRLEAEAAEAEKTAPGDEDEAQSTLLLEGALTKILAGKKRLERLLKLNPSERSEVYGLIASSVKRQAEIVFSSAMLRRVSPSEREQRIAESAGLLLRARDHYWAAFAHNRSNAWVVTQYISLTLILKRREKLADAPAADARGRAEQDIEMLWSLSHLLSSYDLQGQARALPSEVAGRPVPAEERQRRLASLAVWAHGNLLELNLLSLLMPGHPESDKAAERAHAHADSLIQLAGRDSFEASSTRRQIFRYLEWYRRLSDIEPLVKVARQVFDKFPPAAG